MSPTRFFQKLERGLRNFERCVRLFATISSMNADNDKRKWQGKEPFHDGSAYKRVIEEEMNKP